MRLILLAGCLAFWGFVISALTGCGGLELGGKVGLYHVNEREMQESSKVKQEPMSCWFKNCNSVEAQGS